MITFTHWWGGNSSRQQLIEAATHHSSNSSKWQLIKPTQRGTSHRIWVNHPYIFWWVVPLYVGSMSAHPCAASMSCRFDELPPHLHIKVNASFSSIIWGTGGDFFLIVHLINFRLINPHNLYLRLVRWMYGATTFSTTTLSVTALCIMALSLTALCIIALSITTLSIMALLLCWVSFMLNVIYDACHLCWVSWCRMYTIKMYILLCMIILGNFI